MGCDIQTVKKQSEALCGVPDYSASLRKVKWVQFGFSTGSERACCEIIEIRRRSMSSPLDYFSILIFIEPRVVLTGRQVICWREILLPQSRCEVERRFRCTATRTRDLRGFALLSTYIPRIMR